MCALGSFPRLYPDELLYSGLARYHIRCGNQKFRQTDLDLFGYSSQQACRVTLTNNLKGLVNQIAHISDYRVRSLMEHNTLYPFYAAFLTPIEMRKLELATIEKRSGSILEHAKVDLDSTSDRRKYLKFCPECFASEVEHYGEPYWHRSHQIPGMAICTKHRILLLDSTVLTDGRGIHYYALSYDTCSIDIPQVQIEPGHLEHLLGIASDLEWLMQVKIDFRGMGWLRDRYIAELCRRGSVKKLLRERLKIDEPELYQSFCAFYGVDCLNTIEPRFEQTEGKYLIHCLFAGDLDPKIDRVAHVAIARYLFGSIARIFTLK
jgi:TniQ